MNPHDLPPTLYEKFGLHLEAGADRMVGGEWNKLYKLRGRDLVLRISHHRKTRDQLQFELDVMCFLNGSLSFVPRVVPAVDGRLYTVVDEQLCTLFEYKPGAPLQLSDRTVTMAGDALGQIHHHLAVFSSDKRYVNNISLIGFDWFDNYLFTGEVLEAALYESANPALSSILLRTVVAEFPFLRSTREALASWLNTRETAGALEEGVTHGDYYRGNILSVDGTITGVVDWDESVTSWVEYEVANAVWEFARDDTACVMDARRRDLFLNAFSSRCSLSSVDRWLTPLVAVRRMIEIHLSLFDLTQGIPSDLDYCRMNIEYLKRLVPVLDI